MSHILITGRAHSSIKNHLTEHGHTYTVLMDTYLTRFPDKKFKNRVLADFADMDQVLEKVNEINAKKPIDAAFVTYESYVLANSVIAKHLGLPGLSLEAAKACTDKEYMRTLFAATPEKISPAFKVVKSEDDVIEFASDHGFPLILKPANLSKSLLVTKNDSLAELLANYKKSSELLETTYKKYAPNSSPKLLVEEYLEGHIHSVDAFIDSSGTPYVLDNVVDYQTGYDIGFEDNFHFSRILPSSLPASEIESIRHVAAVGCRALGMTSSPAHIEIIFTKNGPRIVEIGARNGGYRERMHDLANGIDITGNAVALSLGKTPDITTRKNDYVGVFELFPKRAGKFIALENESTIKNFESFVFLSVKAKPEQQVGLAADGYKMVAVVMLHNTDREKFESEAAFLRDHCSVITTN